MERKVSALIFFTFVGSIFCPGMARADFVYTIGSANFVGQPEVVDGDWVFLTCDATVLKVVDGAALTFRTDLHCKKDAAKDVSSRSFGSSGPAVGEDFPTVKIPVSVCASVGGPDPNPHLDRFYDSVATMWDRETSRGRGSDVPFRDVLDIKGIASNSSTNLPGQDVLAGLPKDAVATFIKPDVFAVIKPDVFAALPSFDASTTSPKFTAMIDTLNPDVANTLLGTMPVPNPRLNVAGYFDRAIGEHGVRYLGAKHWSDITRVTKGECEYEPEDPDDCPGCMKRIEEMLVNSPDWEEDYFHDRTNLMAKIHAALHVDGVTIKKDKIDEFSDYYLRLKMTNEFLKGSGFRQ